jgi:ubiquinol-cytochrome c reductase cytochrome c subunit
MKISPRHITRTLTLAGVIGISTVSFFALGAGAKDAPYATSRANAGTPNSSVVVRDANGTITSYGNSAITYNLPPSSLEAFGEALFMQSCASCHGSEANGHPTDGSTEQYPSLQGVGPAAIDFWIESGRMPAVQPGNVQAIRKAPRLTHTQALAIAAWVNSKWPGLTLIPSVNTKGANLSDGAALFALNCAACHTIEGAGDALASGTYAPSLRHIPANQIAEAIRTGPGNMPRFTGNLSDAQVRDIVAFVGTSIQHPQNPGGFGLGGLGPVGEGFVALSLGVGLLALAGFWVGDRL